MVRAGEPLPGAICRGRGTGLGLGLGFGFGLGLGLGLGLGSGLGLGLGLGFAHPTLALTLGRARSGLEPLLEIAISGGAEAQKHAARTLYLLAVG